MEIAVLFACLVLFLVLSLPIGIALGMATAVTLALTSDIPLIMIAQNAFAALAIRIEKSEGEDEEAGGA